MYRSTETREYRYADLEHLLTLQSGDSKHEAAATSTLDVIWTLYDRVMHVDPRRPADPDRDRFLLSKGHGPQAYYAVLAAKGFFPVDWLPTYGSHDSPLGHHPDRLLIPGVEISSGSLGHGLPIATGVGLGLRLAGRRNPRVFCLVGDAELDEGTNAEAITFAGRMRLGNLVVIAIDNQSSSLGWPGGVDARFAVEAWDTTVVDGHDLDLLERVLGGASDGRPRLVVAVTETK